MRVHHLSCGTMCPFGGRWINGDAPPTGSGRLVCHVLVVETPRSGLVLVDTGMGLAASTDPQRHLGGAFVAAARPVLLESETALRQIEALGHHADDVRHIVLTHMDLDHAGGLGDFPGAAVHLLAAEHRAAVERPTLAERKRYRTIQWAHAPAFETYTPEGEPWHGFSCVRDLRGLPPEVLLVPLTGHSRGHSAVAVKADRGWLLHAGDAYFHADQMRASDPRCPPLLSFFQSAVAFDRGAMRANQERLCELVRAQGERVRVFSAHDPSELESLQAQGPLARAAS